jgi:hypothetical protein
MTTDAASARQIRTQNTYRQIDLRTRGRSHGSITRLVSPGDIGELIKPFVFLDYFEGDPSEAPKFGFHPHSGIATLTLICPARLPIKKPPAAKASLPQTALSGCAPVAAFGIPAALPAKSG